MDLAELERLVEIVRNANIGELTLRQGTTRVTIRKPPPGTTASQALTTTRSAPTESENEAFREDEEADVLAGEMIAERTEIVIAPSVGVFHHVKPIVGLQARVTEGQVIGVVEAMDLLTEVRAISDGTVTDILVEDGMPVEYGQGLFAVRIEE